MRFLRRWKYEIVIVSASVAIGVAAGLIYAHFHYRSIISASRGSCVRLRGYEFISPLLTCDIADEDVFVEFEPMRRDIDALVAKIKSEGLAKDVSVYLRTLNSGRWLEVEGDKKYTPASLLKVVIMMGYFKRAEEEPAILKKRVVFNGDSTNAVRLTKGQSYTVEQLIEEMIVRSNNDAVDLLLSLIDVAQFDEIYKDLGIEIPSVHSEERLDIMDAHSYSLLFRVLYAATYLDKERSNRALELLARAEDQGGLAEGLPAGTKVAHKFGLRRSSNAVELHDCGIVYYPDHPYLLCVMTRGSADGDLHDAIARISKEVYRDLNAIFTAN